MVASLPYRGLMRPAGNVAFWPIATFPCAADLGRYRGIADIEQDDTASLYLHPRIFSHRMSSKGSDRDLVQRYVRCWMETGSSQRRVKTTRMTPMYGPAVRSKRFVDQVVSGLASMYPAFDWSICSGPSWISARVRSH